MTKVRKLVWRSTATKKDLIIWEPGKVGVVAYDMKAEELPELIDALESCVEYLREVGELEPVTPVGAGGVA